MDDWKRCLGVFAAAVLLLATPADARRVKRGGAKNPVRQAACVAECDTVRNLIYMIGDGMGLAHVTMLQIAEGYDNPVSFMRAENVALIKSYSRNNRVTDSAAAGTALATGHKTNNSMLGVLPDSTAVESMMAKAVRRGMATGLVVTCPMPRREPFMRIRFTGGRSNRSPNSWSRAASMWRSAAGSAISPHAGRTERRSSIGCGRRDTV